MANTVYSDVVYTVKNPATQRLGDISVNTGSPSGQIYSGSEFTGPPPGVVANRLTNRFDETNYYYPGRG